jgi:hypothetical protein
VAKAGCQATPVTLTIQVQPVAVFTTNSWVPTLDSLVTLWPDAPVSLTAGVALGLLPAGATKTWNAGPDGAGLHWKAQPMLQLPPPIVKVGLVQLVAVDCGGARRTVCGPPTVVEVDPDGGTELPVLFEPDP